jgi:hypothetical protein
LTATAVELFVLGQIYYQFFEEIQGQTSHKDAHLMEKISNLERNLQGSVEQIIETKISQHALETLRIMPTAHASVEKVNCCATFLEQISDHFAKTGGDSNALSADYLLKMACQHLLAAKLEGINAEFAFLEEFATSERFSRGRVGYAVVTLLAALHHLNECPDLENEIVTEKVDDKT